MVVTDDLHGGRIDTHTTEFGPALRAGAMEIGTSRDQKIAALSQSAQLADLGRGVFRVIYLQSLDSHGYDRIDFAGRLDQSRMGQNTKAASFFDEVDGFSGRDLISRHIGRTIPLDVPVKGVRLGAGMT